MRSQGSTSHNVTIIMSWVYALAQTLTVDDDVNDCWSTTMSTTIQVQPKPAVDDDVDANNNISPARLAVDDDVDDDNISPARRLAIDDKVDANNKSSTEAGRQQRCRR